MTSHSPAGSASRDPLPAFWIGCSGWAYPSWKPKFYPQTTPASRMLQYFATRLSSVEVNYTFRRELTPAIVEKWLAQTGDGFRFSFKAPQRITHIRRLKECSDALAAFYAALQPVVEAGRMGVVLFQLPPNFKADQDKLATFLEQASPVTGATLRVAFEFRHASWFTEETFSLLRRHQAALCVAESDDLQTPDVETAPFFCYRLRKSRYKVRELKVIKEQLAAKVKRGEVFVYMKHEESPQGALQAAALLKGLRAQRTKQGAR